MTKQKQYYKPDFQHPEQIKSTRENGTLDIGTLNTEPSLAQQQFKDECDINNIMKKYQTTGQFTHLTSATGVYADFSQITDYQEMLDTVRYAQEAFSALPAEMRLRFNNNPGELLTFLQDPNNRAEGESLGLINKQNLSINNNQSSNLNNNANSNATTNNSSDQSTKQKSPNKNPE